MSSYVHIMDDLGWHKIPDSYPNDGEVVLGEFKGEYFIVRYHKHGYGTPYWGDYAEWELTCCQFPKRYIDRWKRINESMD